ncbi:MAG: EMC3/TMCO1 family protein [Candidatus Bathyarchaeota archaeon]|nr:EMC3/TMCO1 family protein [Candidatus Bathyarchaeota archaeon]
MDFLAWLLNPEPPIATIIIMFFCMGISFLNSSINRLLTSKLVGWEQYKTMQKEISEYRKLTSQAIRSKDKKLQEKLKKKEPQILNMQKKMAKPQLALFGINFSYLFIWWFILLPIYGINIVAYIPGIGGIPVIWWYFICSFLFGTLASRLLGIMPIE